MHSEAVAAFDKQGIDLLTKIEKAKELEAAAPLASGRPAVGVTVEEVQLVRIAQTDALGKVTGRYFQSSDLGDHGLFNEGYDELRRLAEKLIRQPDFKGWVGLDFIETQILRWCELSFRTGTHSSLCEYTNKAALMAVRPTMALIPIADLVVEVEISIGRGKFIPVTEEFFVTLERRKEPATEMTRARRAMIGRAAYVFSATLEPEFAMDQALLEAQEALAILNMFHVAAYHPRFTCTTSIAGHQNLRKSAALMDFGPEDVQFNERAHDYPLMWELTSVEYSRYKKLGFDAFAALASPSNLTQLQQVLKTSVLTYSRGISFFDMGDKLINVFSAVEALYLQNTQEPISENVSNRIAFIAESDPAKRSAVIAAVKKAYKFRSDYVHHRVSVDDEIPLAQFFNYARLSFYYVAGATSKLTSKPQLLKLVERVQMGEFKNFIDALQSANVDYGE